MADNDQLEKTVSDLLSYIHYVKETFRNNPSKYQEFLSIVDGIPQDHGVLSGIVKMDELMKDHPQLTCDVALLLPKNEPNPNGYNYSNIPPESRQLAKDFIEKLKITFENNETHVFKSFLKIMNDFKERETTTKAMQKKVVRLLNHHEDLIQVYFGFIPSHYSPEEAGAFWNNLETRFRSLDDHVADCVAVLMQEYYEGKMSANDMQENVVPYLYYHEDLIQKFSRLLPRHLWHPKLSKFYSE